MHLSFVIGHLGADAEVKDYNGRKFVSFRVAHTERFTTQGGEAKERTQWVSCALNGDGGRLVQYLKKGQLVAVVGDETLGLANSQVMRAMVPTCNLHVVSIELLGSSNSDNIPRQLATKDGELVDVGKYFFVSQVDVTRLNPDGQLVDLFDTRGNRFVLDSRGQVFTTNGPAPANSEGQPESEAAEQTEPANNG